MARERTTKSVAKKIALDYFKKPHPFRTWKARLTILGAAGALVAVLGTLLAGNERAYSAGPVSPSHRLFERQCFQCHAGSGGGGFRAAVTDDACSVCHEGVVHQATQVRTPSCASCHVEHRVPATLLSSADAQCTGCHSSLVTRDGASARVATRVVAFTASGHPEFLARRPAKRDTAVLRMNHRVHLKKDLIGPSGPVQLTCADCHRPDATRSLLSPVSYDRDCRRCHGLSFDLYGLFPAGPDAPHGRSISGTADWLRSQFGVLLVFQPDLWKRPLVLPPEPERRLPPGVAWDPPPGPPRSAVDWLDRRTDEATRLLVRRSCGLCHRVEGEIVDPAIPVRWLPASEFRHEPHRFLRCASCHGDATESQETSDILVPGMETCLTCHAGNGPGAAPSRCVTCHRYHPGAGRRGLEGPHTPSELLRAAR